MALRPKIKLCKLSFEIPLALKARIDALKIAADAAGFEVDLSTRVRASLMAAIERNEESLKRHSLAAPNAA